VSATKYDPQRISVQITTKVQDCWAKTLQTSWHGSQGIIHSQSLEHRLNKRMHTNTFCLLSSSSLLSNIRKGDKTIKRFVSEYQCRDQGVQTWQAELHLQTATGLWSPNFAVTKQMIRTELCLSLSLSPFNDENHLIGTCWLATNASSRTKEKP
jgi:hypothetical protein